MLHGDTESRSILIIMSESYHFISSELLRFFAFANGGKQTRAASAAGKSAIYYSIAFWQLQ